MYNEVATNLTFSVSWMVDGAKEANWKEILGSASTNCPKSIVNQSEWCYITFSSLNSLNITNNRPH